MEKSDSMGMKSRCKRLWDYLGTQIETNKRNLLRNVIASIGFNRTTDSNKIEIVVGHSSRCERVKCNLLFVSICVPPNNPITTCDTTSFPGYHSFPKWAIEVTKRVAKNHKRKSHSRIKILHRISLYICLVSLFVFCIIK